ncbi:MAG TPA: TIGR02996 domain-containing protein [Gemmata sp.]|nr:TIGR02996 domain-containing protein [Gemmata sp.]
MPGTLEALNLAVNATPDDRTVRLVYADALEETGEAAHAARAAFIRAQIEAESLSELDPRRLELMSAAQSLFHQHWLEWWRPVCRAAGLPEPHVPGTRGRGGGGTGLTLPPPPIPASTPSLTECPCDSREDSRKKSSS